MSAVPEQSLTLGEAPGPSNRPILPRWPKVKLREVLAHYQEYIDAPEPKTYPKLSVKLYGKGVVLDAPADGTALKMKRHQLAKAGQVILSEIWGKKGAIGFVPPAGAGALCTSHFFLFDVREDKLHRRWLQAIFDANYLQEQLDADAKGTTGYAAVRPKTLLACEIPLPPLDEQRRIVARIESLTAKVEEARGLRSDSAEEVVALYGRRIAEIFSKQQGDSWVTETLGEYVVADCYGTSEKTNDDQTGTPILRMGNIQDGRLLPRPLKYLHIPTKEREKLLLKEGDILVNRTNSAELVGKCAVFNLEGDYGFASYIIRLRLDLARANPRLVAAYINSPIGRAYMFDERKQMTGQANVNATTLKKLPLPLPHRNVQERFVAELDALQAKLDAVKALQVETAAETDAMLPTILDKAFKGEL